MLPKGTTVAGYRIDGPLGEGALSVVYRATQPALNRTVALKVLSRQLGDDVAFRERFRREGPMQAALDHPHVVTVYDTGETAHGLFVAMRLVRGPTLKELILGRELDPPRTLMLLSQVGDALDAAHELGLTHRDVKPQNVLIGADDHAYVGDFGLTKAPDEAGGLTPTRQFVGTIDYLSPEQIRGEAATASSDVYALAGVLYECLVGKLAYPRPTKADVVAAHVGEAPPRPTAVRPDLPAAIDAVIARGIAKHPDERYGSAGELLRDARRAFGEAVEPAAAPAAEPARPEDARLEDAGRPGDQAERQPAAPAADPIRRDVAERGEEESPPEQPEQRRPPPVRAIAAALAVLGVVAGFALGSAGGEPEDAESGPESSASAGSLELSFPVDWRRTAERPNIAGIRFREPIVLSSIHFPGARLIAGQVEASGPSLLSPDLIARLPRTPARGDAVELGELKAFRYDGLFPRGTPGRLTLYAAPTSEGVATVACIAEPADAARFMPQCARVADSVQLSSGRALALGPSASYARPAAAALRRLDGAARTERRRLQTVDGPSEQSAAARVLVGQYTTAADSLRKAPVGPYERAANDRLLRSLLAVASGYRRAASAARARDAGDHAAAVRSVRAAGASLRRAIAELRALGYRVG